MRTPSNDRYFRAAAAVAGAAAFIAGTSFMTTDARLDSTRTGAAPLLLMPAAEWASRAQLPERRTEVSATTDGRFIYLAGGFGPPEGDERATAPPTLWRYDPQSDEWTALTEIPQGVHHAPFQYHGGRLYILGGFRETSFDPVGNVWIFDLATRAWSEGTPMPTPRGASGWAVLNGRIHVVGGNAQGPETVAHTVGVLMTDDRSVNTHEAYDPVTDTWMRLQPMPTPRNHLGAAAAGGRLHAVLGRADGNYILTTHEVYDPATDSWSTAPEVPTGRSGVAVLEHGGLVYAFGGERLDEGNRRTFDAAERFDPATDAWERLPPMPTARHGLGAAAVGNAIHVISGGPEPAFSFGAHHERLSLE
jgi:N-acetylneuraminic acid mutarotase